MSSATTSSESSEKGLERNRMNYWVQHVAKSLGRNSKKMASEDIQQIRYATSKLLALVQQTEKQSKDSFIKQFSAIDTLITVLQIISCEHVIHNVVNIFIECVGKLQPAKRASVLVNHGLTTVLFQMLKLVSTGDLSLPDDMVISVHILLGRIGQKDRKFAVRARLHQCLMLTLDYVKSNFHNFRSLQHLLQVLKLYTNNSVNASYLGKNNSINIMFRVISVCGKRHTVDLKLALENLNNMTKSKSNSARLVGMGGLPQLLSLHTEWQQLDTKLRYLSIRKAILLILKNITSLKSGRKAFVEADGIRILYENALEVGDCRDMESTILLASVILRKCFPRNKLPVDCVLCPVKVPLPESPNHTPECYSLPNYPVNSWTHELAHTVYSAAFNSVERLLLPNYTLDSLRPQMWSVGPQADESDHSSMDEDDDVDSEDEEFRTDNEEPDEDQLEGPEPPEKRSPEELRMYDQFFPELFDTEPLQASLSQSSATRVSQSYYGRSKSFIEPSESSMMPHVASNESFFDMYKRSSLEFPTTSRFYQKVSSQGRLPVQIPFGRDSGKEENSVSAINLKTGSSVISLELGPRQSPTNNKVPRSLPKGKARRRTVQPAKDKKGRKLSTARGVTEDPFLDSMNPAAFQNCQDNDDLDQTTSLSTDDLSDEFCEFVHDPHLYTQLASDTKSACRFNKLAFPDMCGAKGATQMEGLMPRKFGIQRAKIFEDIDRMIHGEHLVDRVVYDFDQHVAQSAEGYRSNLANRDELRVGYVDPHSDTLKFNAQFECGNLRKAIQVRQYEYDLIIIPDINSNHHCQWFYFEVSNIRSDIPYRFNIVNCEKLNSQFNFGMQPLMLSVMDSMHSTPQWVRAGTDICYYKNHFIRSPHTTGGVKGKSYYTTTFTITFQHQGDVCYLSYHYPYTYTALKTQLQQWEKTYDPSQIYFRHQTLCNTLGGNAVPLLTITAQPRGDDRDSLEEFRSRPYIFLSGRVHPGESNSSWVMKGTIDFLLSRKPQAQQVREMYIFKIVPMLNPDGVLNGNHRSSLVGEDLNRRWSKPCSILHPTIYHTKGLLLYLNGINKTPMVYCDYHGHSRRKNIFMYGCSPMQSWIANDTQNPCLTNNKINDLSFKVLPRLLHSSCASFSLQNCSFVVERAKETTARVVVWRHIGVIRSYTMESSYCGCDQGKYKDMHINTNQLEEMGHKLCETFIKMARQKGAYDQQMPNMDMDASMLSGITAEEFPDDLDDSGACAYKKEIENNTASLLDASDTDDNNDDEDDEEEFDDDA